MGSSLVSCFFDSRCKWNYIDSLSDLGLDRPMDKNLPYFIVGNQAVTASSGDYSLTQQHSVAGPAIEEEEIWQP